jgi:predicted nucleic acid-binding protein
MNYMLDTGFWFALYDETDCYHKAAIEIAETIEYCSKVMIPWPSLYEVLNTRFTKREYWIMDFRRRIKNPKYIRINDEKYREHSIEIVVETRKRSLVDQIICSMIEDKGLGIKSVVTFNRKDFVDICCKKGINIIDEKSI